MLISKVSNRQGKPLWILWKMNFIIRIGPYAIMRGSKELQKGSKKKKNHLEGLVLLTYQSLQEARHIQQLEFTHKEAWYNS